MSQKKIRVRLVHSTIGRDKKQEKILSGLGLRKLYSERELVDTPSVRGIVAKIPHLVRIVEENITSKKPASKRGSREVKKDEAE